jgi:putative ABC transport system substrate-binding protein
MTRRDAEFAMLALGTAPDSVIDRRRAVLFVAAAWPALGWAGAVFGQSKPAPILIGWLATSTRETNARSIGAFTEGLAALAWKEGQQFVIEERLADGRTDRLYFLAEVLAAKKPALIVTVTAQATAAATKMAPQTPIVMATGADPVISGFATSLARPGGMITGLSNVTADVAEKYLELLLAAAPKLKRIGFLADSNNPTRSSLLKAAQRSAEVLRVEARIVEIANPEDIEPAISRLAKEGAQALVVMSSPTLSGERPRILKLALALRWPVIASARIWTANGVLVSYGVDVLESFRRAAYYADRILKGAKPGDLPFEQPTKIELVINLKTAKALGLTIPQSLLLRADEVIQ